MPWRFPRRCREAISKKKQLEEQLADAAILSDPNLAQKLKTFGIRVPRKEYVSASGGPHSIWVAMPSRNVSRAPMAY